MDYSTISFDNVSWSDSDERKIIEPYTYITAPPSKEVRAQLISAFNKWLNIPEEKLLVISKVISMLHNASLLIDDVEDDSQLRRGVPVAHKVYGVPQTINSANYVYFLAYQELFKLRDQGFGSPEGGKTSQIDKIVTEELLNLHRGQGMDLFWRDTLTCPTEEEYVTMVSNKTGGLLRLAVKLMMACSTSDVDGVPLVNLIGIYYQIRDDYMNLQSSQYNSNKGYCEDLSEGKFSFPVVHSIRADDSNRQILNVLSKRPATPTLKRYAVQYMQDTTDSFTYTLKVMHQLEERTREEIKRMGGNVELEAILDRLHVEA